jgi:heme/copper-type cytochrome/quinol oxidase subunit 2
MEGYNSMRMETILSWAEVFATILTMTVLVGITVFVLVALSGMRRESRRERGPAPPPSASQPRRSHGATLHGWVILCLLMAA